MAVEVEATGQVDEFLRVLKRRVWWIVVPLSVIGSVGVFFGVVVPKKYVADTEIMVMNMKDATSDSGERVATIEGQAARSNLMANVRIRSILETLAWDEFTLLPEAQKEAYVANVRTDIEVDLPSSKPNSERQKVVVTYKHTDKGKVLDFLRALITSWKDEVLRRNLQQEKKEREETKGQLSVHTHRLSEIGTTETEIRTQNGIVPPRRTLMGMEYPIHPAYGDLDEVERSIAQLEDEIEEKSDDLDLMVQKRGLMSAIDESGDLTAGNPVQMQIEGIDMRIEKLVLDIDAGNWRPSHSSRKRIESEIERYRKRRAKLQEHLGAGGMQGSVAKPNAERLKLTEDIDDLARLLSKKKARLKKRQGDEIELRQKVAQLNDANEELERLSSEKSGLRETTKMLQRRLATLEINVAMFDSDEGDPFMELKVPTTQKATSPNPYIIGIGSIIAGLGLGLALAILLEYSKNCFRSGRELSRVMPHPVLGTINSIRTRRERARGLVVRTVMAGGSIAFVASVTFVTWAWATENDALSSTVTEAIKGFRRMLM